MPMMIMPGANLQPPQYGWVRQQQLQQHLVQQPVQPKPPSDPNPPGTFAPPPPPPSESKATPHKPPTPVAPPVSKSIPPSFLG